MTQPHRGFETLTATIAGLVDHTDSVGNAGRYGNGDLQWMTAGKGIVHGEMFPLLDMDGPNPLRLFQIWLNLPRASKMVPPSFVMHWSEDIPSLSTDDGLGKITVWAGSIEGASGLPPPPDSFAAKPDSEVAVWLLRMEPGAVFHLPPASSNEVNRALYFVDGDSLTIAGRKVDVATRIDVAASEETSVANTGKIEAAALMLQGRPIGEPVAQQGPFVMTTQAEIQQAFSDYRATRFGGWPWPQEAMVFPRDKGRFALLNGEETQPVSAAAPRHGGEL